MHRRAAKLALCAVTAFHCLSFTAAAQGTAADSTGNSATINRDDRLQIAVADLPGISEKPFLVESDGTVTLPLAGRMQAEGLTVEQFRGQAVNALKTYIRTPLVSVKLITKTERQIAVGGGFKNPGVHPLPEQRSLINVISAVGGLQPAAGSNIKIVRRLDMGAIPLPTAVEDQASNVSTATVNLTKLMANPGAMSDLVVMPNDVLSAEPPSTVYLTGEVLKPGAYDISDRESVGLTELISMGGGAGRDADPKKARVLRKILNGAKRAEIPVDIVSILDGQSVDFPIQANDIVEIPRRKSKGTAAKGVLRYVVPAAASGLIYTLIRR